MHDEPRKQQSGLSIKTLLIAGAASATAALVVPMFWKPGTVFAAAVTPIIVAIVQEVLKRPVDTVSSVTARRTTGGAVVFEPPPEEPFDPLAPAPDEELDALRETTTQRAVHRRRPLTGRQWKLALLTGLLAFVCAAAVVTASELVAGDPVSGERGRTTFFGGAKRDNDKDATSSPTPSATATPEREEEATPTPTPTATPTPTETPAPSATLTPEPGAAPQSAPSATPTPLP